MADISFLEQLVHSMEEAVLKLEEATTKKKKDEVNRLRTFIFDLHKQIDSAVSSNV